MEPASFTAQKPLSLRLAHTALKLDSVSTVQTLGTESASQLKPVSIQTQLKEKKTRLVVFCQLQQFNLKRCIQHRCEQSRCSIEVLHIPVDFSHHLSQLFKSKSVVLYLYINNIYRRVILHIKKKNRKHVINMGPY